MFRVKQRNEFSELKETRSKVLQDNVLDPILYLLYTYDLPQIENVRIVTFADNTSILAVGKEQQEATQKLQQASDRITDWAKDCKIKQNELKSTYINFANKNQLPVCISDNIVPYGKKTTIWYDSRCQITVKKKY